VNREAEADRRPDAGGMAEAASPADASPSTVERMSSFDPGERLAALEDALAAAPELPETSPNVNMHIHSFFSFNAAGWSPTRIVWEGRMNGFYAAALCDFDVLDGMEEFLRAGRKAGLRTAVHLETRVFFPELGDVDISSPGEPGVTYIMGAGFAVGLPPGSPRQTVLASFRRQAEERNRALLDRINERLKGLSLDYETDVLPLTPAGCATERHIVRAYTLKAEARFQGAPELAAFWAEVLGVSPAEADRLGADRPSLEEAVRARLVKRGGLAYRAPTTTTFPPIDRFIEWVLHCGAIPMATWLDGTSAGEADPDRLLDLLVEKDIAAVNIIPDRNWRVKDPAEARTKRRNLDAFVRTAVRRELPINVGTEMNKRGLPLIDHLDVEALRDHRGPFLRGARVMVGHALLSRYAGFSYAGEAARAEFGADTAGKNAFFARVGALPALREPEASALRGMTRERALATLADSGRAGAWRL